MFYFTLQYNHRYMTMGLFLMKSHDTIPAGEFKAKCLKLMDEVQALHHPIVITKHGKPVAKLVPIEDAPVEHFGCMQGMITIQEDITQPIDVTWDAEND
jgi:prevent-host-death family protein